MLNFFLKGITNTVRSTCSVGDTTPRFTIRVGDTTYHVLCSVVNKCKTITKSLQIKLRHFYFIFYVLKRQQKLAYKSRSGQRKGSREVKCNDQIDVCVCVQ